MQANIQELNNKNIKLDFLEKSQEFLTTSNERILVDFIKNNNDNLLSFTKDFITNNLEAITNEYPVFKSSYLQEEKKTIAIFNNISKLFEKERNELINADLINTENSILQDINIGSGDFHNGSSTSIIKLNNDKNLVFKPTNGLISESYFQFLNWVNGYLNLGNYQYHTANKTNYHWQEFVLEKSCNTEEEITNYYRRSGNLLCILYLLNSTDFHSENIIANGSSPLLIDHETIIQPKISDKNKKHFKQFNKGKEDTVLNSFLLPNNENRKFFPIGMCGLGCSKETHIRGYKKVGVNRFTKDWKMDTLFMREDFIKNNVPTFKGKKVFVEEYLEEFIDGFEECYKLFLTHRNFLLSEDSPIKHFNNVPVRFIWRATSVYGKIFKYMKLPRNLKDKELYYKKIRDYLSIAFKNTPKDSPLLLMLEHEITQMLRGDIPYFEIDSSSRDLHTEHGVIKDFFELSCIDNFDRKLNKLSQKDLDYQKKLIIESITK